VAIAVLSIGFAGTTATLLNVVYAKASTPDGNNPSDFGQKASQDLAKDGEMGQHSSDQTEPRSGIGNVFNSGDPKDSDASKHPSDTIDKLCSLDPSNSACNPNP
jgi:hypothetical protein